AGSTIVNDDEVWINQGGLQGGTTGVFTRTQLLANGPSYVVQLGDLDGNSSLDLLIGTDGQQRIWWNNGSGAFSAGPSLNHPFANDMALGDLDNDNDLDIVMAGEGSLRPNQVFWNNWNSGGVFTAGPTLPVDGVNNGVGLAHLDDDAFLDIYFATSQANVVWWNKGDKTFTAGAGLGSENDSDVALGDLDDDNDIDAFVTRRLTTGLGNGLWLNGGNRTFTPGSDNLGNYNSFRVALADLDNDSDLDALVANSGPNKVWLNTTRSGPVEEKVRPFTQDDQVLEDFPTFGVALGDLDGDGDLDALTTGQRGTFTWLNGAGQDQQGRFSAGQELDDYYGLSAALGDLDGDGDLDAVVSYLDITVRVWLNGAPGGPAGTFQLAQTLAGAPPIVDEVILADIDGDLDLDVVLASAFGSEVWLNGAAGDPAGRFRSSGKEYSSATRIDVGDVDLDGDLDILFTGWAESVLWLNGNNGDPAGVFRKGQVFHDLTGALPTDGALGDLDGDGDLDAFFAFKSPPDSPHGNEIWFNGAGGNPTGTFSNSNQSLRNHGSGAVVLGDLNGDGDLDAWIATNDLSNRSQTDLIWLNRGNGTGQIPELCLGSTPSLYVALGDLDGDDDLDAFAGSFFDDSIWLNNEGDICFCVAWWLLEGESPFTKGSEPRPAAAVETLQTYRSLRDTLLWKTRTGQHYAQQYERLNPEVFALLSTNSALRNEGSALLQMWQPNLQALLDGQGDGATISAAQMQAIASFLDNLSAAGSPALQQAIASELANLPPLSSFAGKTMSEAQRTVLNDTIALPVILNGK
ncbi:MAG: VCBS repeat-containing protein, partial [Caldilineaceae bacterium]|nr:VCBS repeat-containing protein [Caldilineaceae bacterium]